LNKTIKVIVLKGTSSSYMVQAITEKVMYMT